MNTHSTGFLPEIIYTSEIPGRSAMNIVNTHKILVGVVIVIMAPLTFIYEKYFTNISPNLYLD